VRRVARLDEMVAILNASKYNLQVFIQALEGFVRSAGSRAPASQTAAFEQQQRELETRLDRLVEQAATPAQAAELRQLKQSLAAAGRRMNALNQQVVQRPERLETVLDEARALKDATNDLRLKTFSLRARAARELDALALAFVETQTRRMSHALDKTEQQIANLYEYLALENLGEGAQ